MAFRIRQAGYTMNSIYHGSHMRLFYVLVVTPLLIIGCAGVNIKSLQLLEDGHNQYVIGDFEKAISYYSEAIAMEPSYCEAYTLRGETYIFQGKYEEAIKDFEKSIKLNSEHARAYNDLAYLYATSRIDKYRNGPKSLELGLKAVELEPVAYTYDTLAAAYAENGDFGNAIKYQKLAIDKIASLGNDELIEFYKMHLERYMMNSPWRDDIAKYPRD